MDPGLGVEARSVMIENACVSTAGDLNQFVEVGGVRYSHILDPATGLGLTRRVAASVVSREGAVADGLDTALCVMGLDEAGLGVLIEEIRARHAGTHAVIWVVERKAGEREVVVERESRGFPWE